jgi:hypothetical protein
VGRSDVGGGDDAALHAIPEPDEVGDNSVHPARNESAHVFDDDATRADLCDDAPHLSPETGPGAVEPGPAACDADVLAREAATNHLHWRQVVRADVAHVSMPDGVGPVHGEHAAAPRVRLDLPRHGAEPGPL